MRGSARWEAWIAAGAIAVIGVAFSLSLSADEPAAFATAEDDEENTNEQPADAEAVPPNPLGRVIRNLIVGQQRRTAGESDGFGRGRYALRDDVDARAPQNPEHTKRLRQVVDVIESGEWESAERTLRYLLDQSDGALIRDKKGQWVPLHVEAGRLLSMLPADRLAAYRRAHAAAAERELREARQEGAAKLAEVARKYFHTDAGYAAANELGSRHFDRGEFHIAAQWFARLLEAEAPVTRDAPWRLKAAFAFRRAGNADDAARLIEPLVAGGAPEIELGGARVKPREWLQAAAPTVEAESPEVGEWRMPYGNAARTAVAAGSDPLLLPRWSLRLTENSKLLEHIESLHFDLADAGQSAVPSMLPVLVDGKLVYRALAGVRVVESASGRMVWEAPGKWSPEELLGGAISKQLAQMGLMGTFDPNSGGGPPPLMRMLLDDGVSGLLSSDGRRVFVVEDQAHSLMPQMYSRWGGWGGGWSEEEDLLGRSFSTNRLTAYDLNTGRPVWSGGGPLTDELFEVPLAGNYFFGPPAIEGRRAFVIAQKDERILLHAIDAATGLIEWSAWLGFADTKIAEDFPRRAWTAQPAVSQGIVVCPTTMGWLVAVDAAAGKILWAQRFSKPNPSASRVDPEQAMLQRIQSQSLEPGWRPSAPVIAGDAVVFTPPEEKFAYCFNLRDGSLRWSLPRGEFLYLAGVFNKRALFVGGRRVAAYSLASGRREWRVDVPAEAGRVSGRAVATAERLYLPLDSGQLWSIDLATGNLADRWFLPAGGPRLENLALYDGMLISVGTAGATAFEQRDAIEQQIAELTARDRSDPAALLKRAEIHLLERNYAAALSALREIPAERVPVELTSPYRETMLDALAAVVRAAPAEAAGEVDAALHFAESPAEEFEAERLRGVHLFAAEKFAEAFDLYDRLGESATNRLVPRDDEPQVLVREELWAAERLADAWEKLAEMERAPREAAIREKAERALRGSRAEQAAFAVRYGFHPASLQVRLRLAESAAAEGDFPAAAHELYSLSQSSEETIAAPALVRLARLLDGAGAAADAEHFRRVRAARYALANDGAAAAVAQSGPPSPPPLPEDADFPGAPRAASGSAPDLAPAPDWGAFDLRLTRTGERPNYNVLNELSPQSFPSPFFRGHRFEVSAEQQLAIFDRRDDTLHWLVPLRTAENARQPRPASWTAGLKFAVLNGNVLHMLSPIDRRVLWTRRTSDVAGRQEMVDYGFPGYVASAVSPMEPGLGVLERGLLARPAVQGPVPVANSDYVVFRDRRDLIVLDAVTGRVRWRIGGLLTGTRVVGNEQAVFVLPPEDGAPAGRRAAVLAFRAADGRPLPIDNLEQLISGSLAARPRGMVLIEAASGTRLLGVGAPSMLTLRMYDPLSRREIWKRSIPATAYLDLLNDETLAVAVQGAPFQLVHLDTGEVQRFDNAFARQDRLSRGSIVALADDDRVYLILNRSERRGGFYTEQLPHATVNGVLIALDRHTSSVAWRRTVDRQSLLLPWFRHSPVLVFAVRRLERDEDLHLMKADLLAVDRRDGRTLLEHTFIGNNGLHLMNVNARERYVEVGSYNERLRLTAVPRQTPAEGREK